MDRALANGELAAPDSAAPVDAAWTISWAFDAACDLWALPANRTVCRRISMVTSEIVKVRPDRWPPLETARTDDILRFFFYRHPSLKLVVRWRCKLCTQKNWPFSLEINTSGLAILHPLEQARTFATMEDLCVFDGDGTPLASVTFFFRRITFPNFFRR
jgi:hypothetical protein